MNTPHPIPARPQAPAPPRAPRRDPQQPRFPGLKSIADIFAKLGPVETWFENWGDLKNPRRDPSQWSRARVFAEFKAQGIRRRPRDYWDACHAYSECKRFLVSHWHGDFIPDDDQYHRLIGLAVEFAGM